MMSGERRGYRGLFGDGDEREEVVLGTYSGGRYTVERVCVA